MKNLRVSTFICTAITIIAAIVIYMLMLPAMNLRAGSLYGYILLVGIAGTITFVARDFLGDEFGEGPSTAIIGIATGVVLVICIILWIVNGALVTSKTLQKIPEVNEGNFAEDYVEISADPAEAFTLDLDSARRLGDRTIGNIENASWYEVNNEFNLIIYKGVKYRLSPLEYGGLFKYFKAKGHGIPGYVLVNDDTLEATFVKTENPIIYSPSAYFGKNLKRHLRMQFPTYTFEYSNFEIDDEGVGYWVTGVTEPHASLYAGRVIEKVIVTDAYSGESTVYGISDVPEWIDHVYDLDYLMNLAKWHYSYVNGFWNTVFSETGIYKTSYEYRSQRDDKDDDTANFFGYNSFVNKAGQVVYVSGLTPANKSESNKGFITMNTRTGEFIYYDAEGAEESSAQAACESKRQNYGYKATYPVFVNVGGQPTYMMALKDKAGIIQAYGFVNLKNYSITIVDENIEVALMKYKEAIGMEVEEVVVDSDTAKVATGTIQEIFTQTMNGMTYYYYVVDGELYKASATVNELQFLYKVGDEIELKYQDAPDYGIVITINNK